MRLVLSLLLIIFYAVPAYTADEPTIQAQLSSTEFSLNQGSLLSVKITGDRNPKVHLPEVNGLNFQARGKSSQMSFINGSMTNSLSLQYVITANKEGSYSLDGITAEIDGKTYRAHALSFTVKNNPIQKDDDGRALAFIETTVKTPVYLGEKIPVKIHAFFSGKQQIAVDSSPQILGENISMKPFSQNPQQQKTQRENTVYNELTWISELSSVSSGTFPLTFQLDASILKREAQRSSLGGFNDPFFSSMLSTTTRTPLRVMSKEKEITILPLPGKDQPDDFSGAVGQFSLEVLTSTQQADIGEPVQVTMTLTGNGNFDLVHTPHIVDNSQWKSYPAQKIESQQTHQKRFQQVLIAKEGGTLNLPQYSFSYFDPEIKGYITVLSKEKAIKIAGKKSVTQITPEPRVEDIATKERPKNEINLVEQHLKIGPTYPNIAPLFLRTWFLALLSILVFCFLYFTFRYIQAKKRERNGPYYQQLALFKDLKQERVDIQALLDANDYKNAQDSLVSLMQKYFAFHLQKEAQSISPHSLRSLEKNDELVHIFNTLTSASYTSNSLSLTELTEMLRVVNSKLEAGS